MTSNILLCTDLDRTILPNGHQEESPAARPLLRALAARPEVTIAYVSGRHRELLIEAIEEYHIPVPDYAICDVGTTIYEIRGNDWRLWEEWHAEIAPDWRGMTSSDLADLFLDLEELRLQEPEKQNKFKLSYYAPEQSDYRSLLESMQSLLSNRGIKASLIWSIDEMAHVGLLDVLPLSANKLHAIHFLITMKHFSKKRTVFAGDSGNDLAVLTSGLQAVLVRNASDEVRDEALSMVGERGFRNKLYCAKGGFLGLNGNYSAGVLEGLAHFIPDIEAWLKSQAIP